jgi:hypothetical protein
MSFDNVNFHPDEWRYYEKGEVVAFDDLGAHTITVQAAGWYYLEPQKLGSGTLWRTDAT